MTAIQTVETMPDALPGERRKTPKQWLSQLGWRHLIGLIAVVYAAFPIVYVMSASVASGGTLTGSNELFATVSWTNYVTLNSTRFWAWAMPSRRGRRLGCQRCTVAGSGVKPGSGGGAACAANS